MKLLSNPLVSVMLGLLLGVGTGVGLFWREARVLALALHARQGDAKETSRPDKPWDFWTLEIENLASELKDVKATLVVREQALPGSSCHCARGGCRFTGSRGFLGK